jgi:hypothetical protein
MALCLLAFFCNAGHVGQEIVTVDIQVPKKKPSRRNTFPGFLIPGKLERINSELIYPEVYRDYSVPFALQA